MAFSMRLAAPVARRSVVTRAQATDAPATAGRKAGPLQRGGTLDGEQAAGKDAAPTTLAAMKGEEGLQNRMAIVDGKFVDDR